MPDIKVTSDPAALRTVSRPATQEDADYLFPRMEIVLSAYPAGAGLSAVQVGHPVRLFIVKLGQSFLRFKNPVMEAVSDEKAAGIEGCLSLPGYRRKVRRHLSVSVRDDLRDEPQKFNDGQGGMLARVVQHEMDHLDGRCLMDVGSPAHGGRR